jgi:hypothetical protein
MNVKPKGWIWKLTFPFAHDNYTTIGKTIYYPKKEYPSNYVIAHEQFHMNQQADVGIVKFVLLYLFVFPFLWNPWRWKWEYEAYTKGNLYSDKSTKRILRSYKYGWLRNG